MKNNSIDVHDHRILRELQKDTTLALAKLSERVGMSASPCWYRIKNLEKAGVIRERVALLDSAKLGLGVTVFVSVKTGRHDDEWLEALAAHISKIPEVTEFYRMSGDVDYLT